MRISEEQIPFYADPTIEIGRKVNLLVRTGCILMEKGANTTRIVDNVERAAAFMGIEKEKVNVNVTYNTVMVSVVCEKHSHTAFLKGIAYATNMDIVANVSRLTWKAIEYNYTLDQYEAELEQIVHTKPLYAPLLVTLLASLSCACLTILFGGDLKAALLTWVCSLFGHISYRFLHTWEFNNFVNVAMAAFIANALAVGYYGLTGDIDGMTFGMISSALFLVPGVLFINAIDDFLNHYYMAGLGRTISTIMTIGFMTFGILAAIHVNPKIAMSSLSILPTELDPFQLIAAAIVAVGFATMFNAPVRSLPLIALGGTLTIGIRNIAITQGEFSVVVAALIAALVIGFAMISFSNRIQIPIATLTIPSIITMFPGVFLYRFTYALMQVNHLDVETFWSAQQGGITGLMIVFFMTLGVTTPNLWGKSRLKVAKEKHLQEILAARPH